MIPPICRQCVSKFWFPFETFAGKWHRQSWNGFKQLDQYTFSLFVTIFACIGQWLMGIYSKVSSCLFYINSFCKRDHNSCKIEKMFLDLVQRHFPYFVCPFMIMKLFFVPRQPTIWPYFILCVLELARKYKFCVVKTQEMSPLFRDTKIGFLCRAAACMLF